MQNSEQISLNKRDGNFSSSNIWKLIKPGQGKKDFSVAGMTYITEVAYEKILKRPLGNEASSNPTSWGNMVEGYVFSLMGLEYEFTHKTRFGHRTLPWNGAPDTVAKKYLIGDIKSPYTLKAFIGKLLTFGSIPTYREEYPEDYWQLVSNAILLEESGYGKITQAEAIIFCPYKSELDKIKLYAANLNDIELQKACFRVANQQDDELPYLPDDSKIPNLNIWNFDIPEEDKQFLIGRVTLAKEYLDCWMLEHADFVKKYA